MADEDDVMALGSLDIGLDLADAHGNRVTLACDPSGAGPPQMTDVLAVQPQGEGARLSVEATMTLALACEVTRDAQERAWRLLAYYSDVSVSLAAITERGSFAGDDATACYAQDPDDGEALYNTGLQVNLTTPIEWVWLRAPRLFRLRLDRKRTSARRMVLTYEARVSRTLPGTEGDGDIILNGTDDVMFSAGDDLTSWVAIAPDPDAGGVIAMEGEEVRLPCDVTASAPARVAWRLPGGAMVTRTLAAPEDDDGERETPAPGDDAYRERTLSGPRPEEKTRTRGDDVRDAAPGAWRSHTRRTLLTRSGIFRNKRSLGTPVEDISEAAPDSWRKRKRHSPRSDVTIRRDGSLLLRAARSDDAGRYVCVATVGVGASQDRAVRRLLVTSSAGPSRGDDAVTLQKPPGAALTLPCFVSGAAALAWELPGGRLLRRGVNSSSGASVDGNGSLVLASLRGGDSGFFRCLAVNQVGSDAFAVEVAVVSESRGDDVGGVVTGGVGDEEAWGTELEDLIRARPEVRTADSGGNDGRGSNRTSRTRSRKLTAGKPEVGSADRKAETEKQQNRKSLFKRRKPNQAAHEVTSLDPSLSPDRPDPHVWEPVADVRRVRVHVTNPRVSPAHWADVLARVLARNLTVAGSDVTGAVPAPVVAGEMGVTARNADVGGVLVQVTQNPDGIADVRDSYDVLGADIANASNVTFTSEATGKGEVNGSYDVTNSTAANTTDFIDFYDVINTPDVIDRNGINGSHVVINGTEVIVAPNATAANVSAPSAEEEEAETAEEEESAEAPSLRFSGRHDVIRAPPSSPTFRFQPDSESGSSAAGDFRPLRPLQFSVWGAASSTSASGSSEQRPSRGGDFRLGPVGAFPPDLKGSRRRKRPWEFLLTTSSFTSRSGENPAMPTDHITVTPLNRRGRKQKRLQHRDRLIPHPTSGPAGPEELQLPVPEAPPTEVTPPRRKLGKKGGRRRGTVSPLGLLWEQEIVTHGGRLSASPAHHAWSVTSLPVTALRQDRVTGAVHDITVMSSNDAVTDNDIMPHTTTSDAFVFSDDAVTVILANDVTTSTDDIMGTTTDVTAFLDDVMTETEREVALEIRTDDVVHGPVTPNPVVDRTPGTATIFFKEETTSDVNRWDDIVRDDVTTETPVSATVSLTTPDASDITTSAMDDVIGNVVENSTNDVIIITGVGDVIARPLPDNLSASGSAEALLTPPSLSGLAPPPALDVQMSISEEMTSLQPQQEVISMATITPPSLPSVVMAVSSRPVIPPFWPRIHGHLGPPAPPASRGLHRITSHDPLAVTSQGSRVIHVLRGSDLRLRCVVVGGSFPRVLWRLPSQRLLDALTR